MSEARLHGFPFTRCWRGASTVGWRKVGLRALLLLVAAMASGCGTTAISHKAARGYSIKMGGDMASVPGYVHAEAAQFIEFCVELDDQSDRKEPPYDPGLDPQIDAGLWNPVPRFDSREAVAKDFIEWLRRGSPTYDGAAGSSDDDLRHWSKLFGEIRQRVVGDKATWERIQNNDPDAWKSIQRDPDLNGFGPWQNAWLLYEGVGPNAGKYAIAIRGTVFSTAPSAIEDALFQPISAREFLSRAVSFSDSDAAMLHGGFAHATFTLLLDRRYGILQKLEENGIPNGSALFIVGHSQGAAMATLVHAFFDTAMREADSGSGDPLGLKGRLYHLKSYAFAQPKPGNYEFASEFARVTQRLDSAIVVNNDIDPVPKVPLTLQATEDLATDFKGQFWEARLLHFLSGAGAGLRGIISSIAEPVARKSAENYGYFYHYESIRPLARSEKTGSSWNFVPAGRVMFVFGTPLPDQGDDLFFQHHATTYRNLLCQQLGPSAGCRPPVFRRPIAGEIRK